LHQAQYALKSFIARHRARDAQPPPQNRAQLRQTIQLTALQTDATTREGDPTTRDNSAAHDDELGADNLVYREPTDETWREAWRVTEGLIVLMRDEVQAHGARFVVVTLSNGIQVHPAAPAREAFLRRVGAGDLFYPDKRIAALGARAGFPVITLAPELQLYAERNQVFLHGFGAELGNGHWNAEGHRVAGELLTQKLCDLLSR
jgi:hypothetical protein